MFPYQDLAGFKARSIMPPEDIDALEARYPGFVEQRISVRSSLINARLRKRLGNNGRTTSLPLGQNPPPLLAAGTTPPAVTLQGRPTVGSIEIQIQILSAGALGVATFQWSLDNGLTWVGPLTTAASVSLSVAGPPAVSTGLQALFPALTYSTDNVFAADTPVPEVVLGWLTSLVTLDCYDRRGANPQDPALERVVQAATDALAELHEAADSKDGLFDIPSTEDGDSAITTGGPLGASDVSPYAWQDRQARGGYAQDAHDMGTDFFAPNRIVGR